MPQEELHIGESEVIVANDNVILDGEVGAEVDEVSTEVLKTVQLPFLKRILGYLDTEQAGIEIARLDKLRANNDNMNNKKTA